MAIEAPRSEAVVGDGRVAGFAPSLPALVASVHVRWVLQLVLFLELRKGHPMGPVAEHSFPLDDEGHLIALPAGEVASIEGLVGLTTPLLQDLESALLQQTDTAAPSPISTESPTLCS